MAPHVTPDGVELVARNMFCSTCLTDGPGSTASSSDYSPPAVLIATSIGNDPRATLRVPASEVQGSWGLGDNVPGVGTIERIGYVSIDVVSRDGRRGKLRLLERLGGSAGAATPAPAGPYADRLRKIDDTTFEVDRSLVRDLVTGAANPGGTRMVPVTHSGQLDGLRVLGVREGQLAAALGLRNGDVVQAVNNIKIENANTLLDLYAQLGTLNTVELAGTRAGKPLVLTLRLR